MGVDPAACVAEDMLPADAAAWGSGVHAFEVEVGQNGDPSFITIRGTGAFIGLPKAFNGGEYAGGPPAEDGAVRYQVLSYVKQDDRETMQLVVDISANQDGTAAWTFTLVSE